MSHVVGAGHIGIVEFVTAHHDGSIARLLSSLSPSSRPNVERNPKGSMRTGTHNLHNLCIIM